MKPEADKETDGATHRHAEHDTRLNNYDWGELHGETTNYVSRCKHCGSKYVDGNGFCNFCGEEDNETEEQLYKQQFNEG